VRHLSFVLKGQLHGLAGADRETGWLETHAIAYPQRDRLRSYSGRPSGRCGRCRGSCRGATTGRAKKDGNNCERACKQSHTLHCNLLHETWRSPNICDRRPIGVLQQNGERSSTPHSRDVADWQTPCHSFVRPAQRKNS
jgi:hypothetical protein